MKHKEAGNEHFKKGEFQEALREYYNALLFLRGLNNDVMATAVPKDPENLEEGDITELNKDLSVIQANMAACHVRLNRYTRAVQCAQDALKSNPFNKKAKFRLVQGYIREGSLLKAGKLLDELEKDSPNDAAFAAERRNIVTKEAEAEKKQRRELAGMFDRARNED
ncbi:hypothetical protein GGI15_000586 [Coemansia interrupta]|uniref:Tetratricopeptide repeat protein n=1 Tax=Coemansia interrupta TaxID=1126814 RepID=A0A9W8HLR4_9FUNG|nr:hypothetical protein GGI15_000586 [Coemansia interrupta]